MSPVSTVIRSPTTRPRSVGQLAADHRLARAQARAAGHHLVAQVHDAVVAFEFDADQRHRGGGHPTQAEPGGREHRRHGRDTGPPFDLGRQRRPAGQ
jgi:hypothetical protein